MEGKVRNSRRRTLAEIVMFINLRVDRVNDSCEEFENYRHVKKYNVPMSAPLVEGQAGKAFKRLC